jgi:hypothetical protein
VDRACAEARDYRAPGIVFAVVGLVLDRLLARFDLGGVARDRHHDASPERARSISVGWILSAHRARIRRTPGKTCNVASEGTCEPRPQPRMRRRDLLTSRRSIRALVVGTPRTALATKARARARRFSGGRPGPLGGSGTKTSRPITSRVVTRRPNASVIGSLSSRVQGNKKPGCTSSEPSSRREGHLSYLQLRLKRIGFYDNSATPEPQSKSISIQQRHQQL